MTGYLNCTMKITIWWELHRPDVINICTGDRRFVNDEGGRPGLWLKVKRRQRSRVLWNRLARALADAGQPSPPLIL
jgi:hypothetical protein